MRTAGLDDGHDNDGARLSVDERIRVPAKILTDGNSSFPCSASGDGDISVTRQEKLHDSSHNQQSFRPLASASIDGDHGCHTL